MSANKWRYSYSVASGIAVFTVATNRVCTPIRIHPFIPLWVFLCTGQFHQKWKYGLSTKSQESQNLHTGADTLTVLQELSSRYSLAQAFICNLTSRWWGPCAQDAAMASPPGVVLSLGGGEGTGWWRGHPHHAYTREFSWEALCSTWSVLSSIHGAVLEKDATPRAIGSRVYTHISTVS